MSEAIAKGEIRMACVGSLPRDNTRVGGWSEEPRNVEESNVRYPGGEVQPEGRPCIVILSLG